MYSSWSSRNKDPSGATIRSISMAPRAKGVKNNVAARMITFDDYTRCLNEEIEMIRHQSCIRSKLHEVYTISETKIALSPYDDKRYIVPNTTETLPWGHWRIPS
ncbi:hypothetical protein ALC57_16857 [Trachymyrmex cornetzi]|uniref:Uncharacterized protein n=1 Tax=Trachymyrmex cornetzi TaxID=471704 RepID=A0A151IUP6_9HYME|nr:hypothetical protein ALC57_16857 [Trachymyrmex cornetzi]